MKKIISAIGTVFILSTVLAACNTDTEEPKSTAANDQQPENEQVGQVQKEEQPETDTEPANNTKQPEELKKEQKENKDDSTLTYISHGQLFTEDVTAAKSEEMDYTIQHLENYTLVAEEPGVDHLLYNEDEAFSMQIEVAKKEDVTFDQIKTSANDTISAIAPDNVKEFEVSSVLTERDGILNIIGYETELDGEKIVKIAFERENLFATLTIYDTEQADLTDAFFQMGLTIQ
ncbi:chemotaxis protein [Solibacillus silvestris]|uniref:chemotaxis protein n=1 Tax=Solibacillus silvestris TaxID=76853 RepID=UPI003F813A7B